MNKDRPKSDTEEGMSFLDHLEELRSRIIKAVIALAVGCVIAYFFT